MISVQEWQNSTQENIYMVDLKQEQSDEIAEWKMRMRTMSWIKNKKICDVCNN